MDGRSHPLSFKQLFALLFVGCAVLLGFSFVVAWTGPTATAPGGNVAAPINVGTVDQVKNAGLSVDALAVFGSQYIQEKLGVDVASPVVAIETTGTIKIGDGGEVCQAVTEGAIRYNSSAGTIEFCNGTSWLPFVRTSCPADYTFVGTPGTLEAYCISSTARPASFFGEAQSSCIASGAHLCTSSEWSKACWSGSVSLSGGPEWIDQYYIRGSDAPGDTGWWGAIAVGHAGGATTCGPVIGQGQSSANYVSRCCLR